MKPIVLLLLVFAALAPCAMAGDAIVITDAWARAMPPGATTTAVYFNVDNHGDPSRLVAARCACAREIQIHDSIEADGMRRMRPLGSVNLEPGETVAFEPGGMHLMLLGVAGAFNAGDAIVLELDFAAATTKTIAVPVMDPRDKAR